MKNNKDSILKYLAKATVLTFVVILAGYLFFSNFSFALDLQDDKSLDCSLFVVWKKSNIEPKRHEIINAVTTMQQSPTGKHNLNIAKKIVGLPGDTFVITDHYLRINDSVFMANQKIVEDLKKKKKLDLFVFSQSAGVIPNDKYFVIGTNPLSFDSRYWGFLDKEQITGKVFPII